MRTTTGFWRPFGLDREQQLPAFPRAIAHIPVARPVIITGGARSPRHNNTFGVFVCVRVCRRTSGRNDASRMATRERNASDYTLTHTLCVYIMISIYTRTYVILVHKVYAYMHGVAK